MKKIILDTNFLLIPSIFKLDIFSEIDRICLFKYKLFIVDKTINELENIIKSLKSKISNCYESSIRKKQKGKHKEAAKIALQLIKKKNIAIIKTKQGKVDDLILGLLDKDTILATEDSILRKKAIKKGIKAIVLRSKKYLVLK